VVDSTRQAHGRVRLALFSNGRRPAQSVVAARG
jgi:hypothetical protein